VFGFHVLWVFLISIGTLMRGPGWNFFWPWERWDPHYVGALTNVDLSEYLSIPTRLPDNSLNPVAMAFGAVCVGAVYVPGIVYWLKNRETDIMKKLGPIRFAIVSFLFLTMVGVVLKVLLRLGPPVFGLNPVKYVWVTPWFNV